MDPLLIAVDLLIGLIGLFVVWIARRLQKAGKTPHKAAVPVFVIGAVMLLVAGTMVPSRILTTLTASEVEIQANDEEVPAPADEPDGLTVVENGSKGQTIIITDNEDLLALLRQAIAQLPEEGRDVAESIDISTAHLSMSGVDDDDDSGDDDSTTEDDDSGDVVESAQVDDGRDPFKVTGLVQGSEPVIMTPVTSVMTRPRARIRNLPTEPTGEAAPMCTDFKLLHGSSGGPRPSGCHAVGCSQGYALPMQHLPSGGWGRCTSVGRLERIEQCYVVPDADGTEHGRTFSEDGSWVECPVS